MGPLLPLKRLLPLPPLPLDSVFSVVFSKSLNLHYLSKKILSSEGLAPSSVLREGLVPSLNFVIMGIRYPFFFSPSPDFQAHSKYKSDPCEIFLIYAFKLFCCAINKSSS